MDKSKPALDRLPPELTQNIAEHLQGDHESLEAFRALRLSCKEVYMNTFRAFALAYFTNLSVAFTTESLHRLRDVATHKNSFGKSLSTFPKTLTCSTYRLPTGNAVGNILMTTSDPNRKPHANEVADAISRACQKGSGLFGNSLSPYDHPRTRDLALEYMKAVEEQSSIESTGDDVKLVANALAALPNVRNIGTAPDRHAWGQDDWDTLAGIKIESFLSREHLASGETNLTITARKLLAAVAEAASLRKSRGHQLIIEQVDLQGGRFTASEFWVSVPRNLQLHKLNISDPLLSHLKDAFSKIKRLYVSVHGLARIVLPGKNVDLELEQSRTSLQALFSNPVTEEFCLDLFEPLPVDQYRLVPIHSKLIEMIIETHPFTSLRRIEIYSPFLLVELPSVCKYIQKHAATLEKLRLGTYRGVDRPDAAANRELWRPVLRAAAGCAELADFAVWIRTGDPAVYDIDFGVQGREAVSELLAKLVVSPTEPAKELGWVQ